VDISTGMADDAVDRRETQAGAFPGGFRVVKNGSSVVMRCPSSIFFGIGFSEKHVPCEPCVAAVPVTLMGEASILHGLGRDER
jgi:hypothetical protein